jgi:GxxExxY protein
MTDDELTYAVIGRAYRVYNELGYGFLESGYVGALCRACWKVGLSVEREVPVPLFFDGEVVANYRADVVVEKRLMIEAKTASDLQPGAIKQVWNYLRCTNLELALLLNFGPKRLDIRRYSFPNAGKQIHGSREG